MGKISKRPTSIRRASTKRAGVGKPSTKEAVGPASPRAGPMLPRDPITPLTAVTRSVPRAATSTVPPTTNMPYTTMKPATRSTRESGRVAVP